MNVHTIRCILAAALFLMAPAAFAEDLPAPINGITFEEWAAGNARLSNEQKLADVIEVLGVDEKTWNDTNMAFIEVLRKGDPAGYTYRRYAEVFADPAVGRFKGAGDTPEVKGKLATFEDYARVQAHMTVGYEAGQDPAAILKEHGLTVYEYSQEAKPWIQEIAKAAGSGRMDELNVVIEHYTQVYRARYKLD